MAAGAATGLAAVGVVASVVLLDPNEVGHYPTCPFLAVTGLPCPGCGSLRALHALSHGHLARAVGFNALTVALLPLLAVGWVVWVQYALGRRTRAPDVPGWVPPALAVVVPAFWLLRNLPFAAALAP